LQSVLTQAESLTAQKLKMVQRGYRRSKNVLLSLLTPAFCEDFLKVQTYWFSGTPDLSLSAPQDCDTPPVIREPQSGPHNAAPLATRPGVGIALGGGFARGFAHLGVLQVLEQHRIPISCIAGTSVGSILGAAYASGAPLARIIATCRTLKFRDIGRWSVSRLGLASNHRLGDLIDRVFDSQHFEDLRIPLAVVATDLNHGEPVVLTHGNLKDAIRASCAFPGLFEPVNIGTRCLVDGGLVAPVPTQAARKLGAEFVLGVSVGIQDGHRGAPSNIFQVVARAVSAAQKHQLEGWERHADLVLRPDVQSIAWDDFERADEAIEAGVAVARRAIPRIEKFLERAEVAARGLESDLQSMLVVAEATH
jgi:NTE family protein